MLRRDVILFLFVSFLCAGCGTMRPSAPPPNVLVESDGSGFDGGDGAENPFVLQIAEERYTGDSLKVSGFVKAKTYWNPNLVNLRLRGLADGEQVALEEATLAQAAGLESTTSIFSNRELPPDAAVGPEQPVAFALEVRGAKLSDYQLEMSWTEGGRAATPAPGDGPAAGQAPQAAPREAVTLDKYNLDIIDRPCPSAECPVQYRVRAALVNTGSTSIGTVVLGVGYVWVPRGDVLTRSDIPENEEKLIINNLSLSPGASRPLRLVLKNAVPKPTSEGGFKPVVRVLTAK